MAPDVAGSPVLLDDATAVRAFCREHLGADPGDAGVAFLTGGVSSIVARVDLGGRCLVVKQALPELKVTAHWASRTERALIEAAAAETLDTLVPGSVPKVRVVVSGQHAFAMDCAPATAETWKARLMRGDTRVADAERAGTLLGRIHARSAADPSLARTYADRSFFDELRVDPYLRYAAAAHLDLTPVIGELVAALEAPGTCLVHGDFSPKNLLVHEDDGLLLIDHEVAHWGVPAFDIAFVLTHLCLKAVRFAPDGARYLDARLGPPGRLPRRRWRGPRGLWAARRPAARRGDARADRRQVARGLPAGAGAQGGRPRRGASGPRRAGRATRDGDRPRRGRGHGRWGLSRCPT